MNKLKVYWALIMMLLPLGADAAGAFKKSLSDPGKHKAVDNIKKVLFILHSSIPQVKSNKIFIETFEEFLQRKVGESERNPQIQSENIFYAWVEELLQRGANPNVRSVDGHTPLHLVMLLPNPDVEVIRLLLDEEASIEIRNNSGRTPLMFFFWNRLIASTNEFLDYRASLAEQRDRANAIIKLFIEQGFQINQTLRNGSTLLQILLKYMCTIIDCLPNCRTQIITAGLPLIEALINNGADPSINSSSIVQLASGLGGDVESAIYKPAIKIENFLAVLFLLSTIYYYNFPPPCNIL